MPKKFYNLTIICEGAAPDFTVDEATLASFENAFDAGEGTIKFLDAEDKGEVVLRNNRLAGYKKTWMEHLPAELKKG
ncbi:MAG: hypothetical protein HY886_09585 [Deltaproteobacteria bacterium]|nr:hypothetical protein [Deltaproteobacteria bacterium]